MRQNQCHHRVSGINVTISEDQILNPRFLAKLHSREGLRALFRLCWRSCSHAKLGVIHRIRTSVWAWVGVHGEPIARAFWWASSKSTLKPVAETLRWKATARSRGAKQQPVAVEKLCFEWTFLHALLPSPTEIFLKFDYDGTGPCKLCLHRCCQFSGLIYFFRWKE